MKKAGLFLLKNNIHLMTLCFAGWAVWAICCRQNLTIVQELVIGLYGLIVLHEYEESYKNRFLELMLGRVMGIDYRALLPGIAHIVQALYITLIFSAALIWHDQLWIIFAVLILGIVEGIMHTASIFLFRLRGVSPGWWTAVLMCAYSICAIVLINQNVPYEPIQWLWGILMFFACFLSMELLFQKMVGNTLASIRASVARFRKEHFGA
ncbi:MAG: HXXEE domain-containing protein [Paludibacteraceae bacterium]